MASGTRRIKCPIILTVVGPEQLRRRGSSHYLFTLLNVFDEFSHPVFPAFLKEVDSGALHELVEELGDIDNVSVDTLRRLGKMLWTVLPREITSYLTQLEERFVPQIRLATTDITLPWEIICDDQGFWSLRYSMGRILGMAHQGSSSMRVLGLARDGVPNVLLIYDPDESLESALEEGETLRRLMHHRFRVDHLSQREATLGAVFRAIVSDDYDIIHFAGHARIGKRNGLVCHNGVLLAAKTIEGFSLKRRPVVFANACSTATKSNYYGGAGSSLAEAFIKAGARAFVGTLWKPADKASAKFAVEFYRHLAEGSTIGDGIRRTRLESSKRSRSNEIDWAGFALYGNPDSRLHSPRDNKEMKNCRMDVVMSNNVGTLAAILASLAENRIDIVAGHSITFDNEADAGYVANVKIPTTIDLNAVRKKMLQALGQDLLLEVTFSETDGGAYE